MMVRLVGIGATVLALTGTAPAGFGPPVTVRTGPAATVERSDRALARLPGGRIVAVGYDAVVLTSDDDGRTWSVPVALDPDAVAATVSVAAGGVVDVV